MSQRIAARFFVACPGRVGRIEPELSVRLICARHAYPVAFGVVVALHDARTCRADSLKPISSEYRTATSVCCVPSSSVCVTYVAANRLKRCAWMRV
jgi:hypothetical protein